MSLAEPGRRPALPRGLSLDGEWGTRALMLVIALYLVASLVLPLYAMLSKSFETYRFQLQFVEMQQEAGNRWREGVPLAALADRQALAGALAIAPTERTRIPLSALLPQETEQPEGLWRVRDLSPDGGMLLHDGSLVPAGSWLELRGQDMRRVLLRPVAETGLGNYLAYVTTPSLRQSAINSIAVSLVTTIVVIPLAFLFAYALTRSRMPLKGLFRTVAMMPLLVPSILPGLALIYLFGRQGILNWALMGAEIYGPLGIVLSAIFFTFPHAFLIIAIALSITDARLHEASDMLGAGRWRRFWTVTVPGARYGLVSAAFVVFTLTITDFGAVKVIGGQYDLLALDIYKQVVGQQNFQMGAVVSVVLLVPAVIAFVVDRQVQRRQTAQVTGRLVPLEPKPNRRFDLAMLGYCLLVALFIVGILAICQYAALVKLWPYNLSLGWDNYRFDRMDGGGWGAYRNSLTMAFATAVIGTCIIFLGAYLSTKVQGFASGRAAFHLLAMLPMAVPGMVLGLAYVFFFNDPANPLYLLYGTMAILVISTITHFYTVAHLGAVTALKQMDPEFESVSASLQQPQHRMFRKVTVPVCLPAILDISIYLFVNAMTTVSAVIFLYSPTTQLASVAALNMEDAGQTAPAAAMCMMIFYGNAIVRLLHAAATRGLTRRTQAWRSR